MCIRDRLASEDFGARVELELLSASTSTPGSLASERVALELWTPPRRTTRFRVPILYDYQADARSDDRSVTVLDLWVISLYEYEREGASKAHRFLRWFEWSSGAGELEELSTDS